MKIAKKALLFIIIALILCLVPVNAFASANLPFSSDYLAVPNGQSVIRILIENSDSTPHSYKLLLDNLPEGFKSIFTADGVALEELNVPAASEKIIELHVDVPPEPTQGNYKLIFSGTREDGQKTTMPISITINNNFAVKIASQIKTLQTLNGKDINFDIAVLNTGNKELKDLSLTTSLPYKWTIESIAPEKVSIAPGKSAVYKVNIFIPPTQAAINTEIKIKATNQEAQSQEVSIPVTVTANTDYAWLIIVFVVIAAVATIIYFRKHGRR
jgi:uncharacterized membrane protein